MSRYKYPEFSDGFSEKSDFNLYKLITQEVYKNLLEMHHNNDNEYKTNGLRFYYRYNDTMNATARVRSGFDEIVINTGTITQMRSWIFSAFSTKGVLRYCGDSSKENNVESNASFDYENKDIIQSEPPIDESRRKFAEYTALFGIRFICMHELGHLLNGHAALFSELYGFKEIEMRQLAKDFKLNPNNGYALDRRTIEMDADAFAVTQDIVNLDGIIKNNVAEILDLLPNPYTVYHLWAFAVQSFFLLLEKSEFSEYNDYMWYLPNVGRQRMNIGAAMTTVDMLMDARIMDVEPLKKRNILLNIEAGIREAQLFFNMNKNTEFDYLEGMDDDVEYNKYFDEVLEHWDTSMKQRLSKYARSNLSSSK